jgi:hypothetical protein
MRLYIFAELTVAEAAALGALLDDGDPAHTTLRRKLIAATVPTLPPSIRVLHDEHNAHRAVLLLDEGRESAAALEALCMRVHLEYGQSLTPVPLAAVQSVDALDRLVRELNHDAEGD